MVNRERWNKKTQILVAQLEEDCEFLESQKECLIEMWTKFNGSIFTFYETKKTNVVKEVVLGVLIPCNISFYDSQANAKLNRWHQEYGIDLAIYSKWCRNHQHCSS